MPVCIWPHMKQPRYTWFILLALISLVQSSAAQPFETIFAYRMHYHVPSEYDDPNSTSGEKFELFQNTLDFSAPLPIRALGEKSFLFAGIFYHRFRFSSLDDGVSTSRYKFNRTTFKLGMTHLWGDAGRHKSLVVFLATWASQDDLFGDDSFQPGFLAMHNYKFSDNFALRIGLYYNREFFGNFFMPLLGIDWRLRNDWYLFGLLPGTFNIYKKLNSWFAMSLSHRGPTGSLWAPDSPGDYVRYGRGPYSLAMLDLHFTPWSFSIHDHPSDLTFSLSIGHTIKRTYELYLSNKDQVFEAPFYHAKEGWYLKGTVWIKAWN